MKHFKISEFNCPCCDGNAMHYEFLNRIDEAREIACVPFVINSGWRCEKHNREVGGSPTSSHLSGWAADVRAETDHQRYCIIMGAMMAGISRILIYRTFIHLDNHPTKSREIVTIMEQS